MKLLNVVMISFAHQVFLNLKNSVNYEKSFFKKQFINKSIHEKESEEEYWEMLQRWAEICQC